MEPTGEDERPSKRPKTDRPAGMFTGRELLAMGAASFYDPAYRAAESALDKIAALNRDQALHLLESRPEIRELLHLVAAQNAPGNEQATASHDTSAATEKLVQEKQQLEETLNKEIEGRKRDKQNHERKIQSLSHLCVRVLQQRQEKLENTLNDLRNKADTKAAFPTRPQKDAEIARLHGLVANCADDMIDDFKASVEAAAKMLGQPMAQASSNTVQHLDSSLQEMVASKAAEDESEEDGMAEDEKGEGEKSDDEYQDSPEKQTANSKKLYSTDWVDRHPNETFHHRASGRWLKGLPPADASAFTGVRGPLAKKWKEMREKRDADKPKVPRGEKQEKKTEQETGNKVKLENMTPGPSNHLANARKVMQLEATVRDLQFKLRELRAKLEEEVGARRKAEAELASMRNGA